MIFEWNGLQDQKYFIIKQKSDPLKYCNYALPFPMAIGLPFMPCDLPNQYQLFETNETYDTTGALYLTFEQQVSLIQRILIPASHRPWKMTGKDYYNHTPYISVRNLNLCFSPTDRPEVNVYMQGKNDRYVGKIKETTILNCCCIADVFQELEIYDSHNELIYKVRSRNPQRGHFIILPFCNFNNIQYEILKISFKTETLAECEQESQMIEENLVGQIVHLFNGFSEYTSKNDKYGITLPADSTEEQKCLILHSVLLIDYLLFQNF